MVLGQWAVGFATEMTACSKYFSYSHNSGTVITFSFPDHSVPSGTAYFTLTSVCRGAYEHNIFIARKVRVSVRAVCPRRLCGLLTETERFGRVLV